MILQIPSPALPAVIITGLEMEVVADLVTHVSPDFSTEWLQEKAIHIMAVEVVLAPGVPGPLQYWVEVSPVPSSISTAYFAAIGGGGGALPPVAPFIEAGLGIPGTVHTMIYPWVIHSPYARLVVQTPVAVALPIAFWWVQAWMSGKGT